jgi:hypothetical protein
LGGKRTKKYNSRIHPNNFCQQRKHFVWFSIAYGVSGNYFNLSGVSVISGLTAGSNTFKLRGVTENNTATVLAQPTGPLQFMIEDMGAERCATSHQHGNQQKPQTSQRPQNDLADQFCGSVVCQHSCGL